MPLNLTSPFPLRLPSSLLYNMSLVHSALLLSPLGLKLLVSFTPLAALITVLVSGLLSNSERQGTSSSKMGQDANSNWSITLPQSVLATSIPDKPLF